MCCANRGPKSTNILSVMSLFSNVEVTRVRGWFLGERVACVINIQWLKKGEGISL